MIAIENVVTVNFLSFVFFSCVKYKPKTLSPKWLEQFHLYMYEGQTKCLEIAVWDHDTGGRDDIMGR